MEKKIYFSYSLGFNFFPAKFAPADDFFNFLELKPDTFKVKICYETR